MSAPKMSRKTTNFSIESILNSSTYGHGNTATSTQLPRGDVLPRFRPNLCSKSSMDLCGPTTSTSCKSSSSHGTETEAPEFPDSVSSSTPDTSVTSVQETSSIDILMAKRGKKGRTTYSDAQVDRLEARYKLDRYLPITERDDLAEELGLTSPQVKYWFQNRRMKEKRQIITSQYEWNLRIGGAARFPVPVVVWRTLPHPVRERFVPQTTYPLPGAFEPVLGNGRPVAFPSSFCGRPGVPTPYSCWYYS